MLTLIVFINGMALMTLEMVGARILAPWLGTSIVVWTSLIGTILASLSLGAWLGGRLADSTLRPTLVKAKHKHDQNTHTVSALQIQQAKKILAGLLCIAACLVLVTGLVQALVLSLLSKAGLSLHSMAVIAAIVLFAGPSLICGMVSPYATRLAITHAHKAGAVVGKLSAIGTLGSIVGTFAGGFVLIAWFGSLEIIFGVAACFVLAACMLQFKPVGSKLLLLALCGTGALFSQVLQTQNGTIIETAYNTMRVVEGTLDNRPARLLLTDPGSYQSGIFLDNPSELAFPYTRYYALGTNLNPDAQKILMLGGGGYSVPKWLLSGQTGLKNNNFQLDVVELDPGMTKVAQSYFEAPKNDPRLRVHHQDARWFLNSTAAHYQGAPDGPYNLIFGDVFNSHYSVPFHVGTKEAAEKIYALLDKDGIFLMNIITAVEGDKGRLLRSIHHAFGSVFPQVVLFPVHSPQHSTQVQNVMLMALRTPRALPSAVEAQISHPKIAALLQNRWGTPLPHDIPPLTDNYAPVDRYVLGQHLSF